MPVSSYQLFQVWRNGCFALLCPNMLPTCCIKHELWWCSISLMWNMVFVLVKYKMKFLLEKSSSKSIWQEKTLSPQGKIIHEIFLNREQKIFLKTQLENLGKAQNLNNLKTWKLLHYRHSLLNFTLVDHHMVRNCKIRLLENIDVCYTVLKIHSWLMVHVVNNKCNFSNMRVFF